MISQDGRCFAARRAKCFANAAVIEKLPAAMTPRRSIASYGIGYGSRSRRRPPTTRQPGETTRQPRACGGRIAEEPSWRRFGPRSGLNAATRSPISGQHRIACEFFGYRFPRGVSREQHSADRSHVLARGSHVALRRNGMASPVRARINLSCAQAIPQWEYDSTAHHTRAARCALDVRARSAV